MSVRTTNSAADPKRSTLPNSPTTADAHGHDTPLTLTQPTPREIKGSRGRSHAATQASSIGHNWQRTMTPKAALRESQSRPPEASKVVNLLCPRSATNEIEP